MIKMTDDEIMRFNEELMAKIHKRKVQPLEDSGGEKEVKENHQRSISGNLNKNLIIIGDISSLHESDDSKLPEHQCNQLGCKKAGIYEFNGIPYCGKHYDNKCPDKRYKLPEPKEEKCRLIKNAKNDPNWDGSLNAELCKGDCETCPYNEPKANEPEKDYIKKSSIFVGNYYYPCNIVACPVKEAILSYEGNNYCMKHFLEFIQYDAKKELIGRFIKFIDHFEGRYEGNKCGECLEYWKTIKEHYKGA